MYSFSSMNPKLSIVVILAITAFLATAATATFLNPTPVDAVKPNYCKPGSTGCFSSQTQCEKRSPGGSGGPHCD